MPSFGLIHHRTSFRRSELPLNKRSALRFDTDHSQPCHRPLSDELIATFLTRALRAPDYSLHSDYRNECR